MNASFRNTLMGPPQGKTCPGWSLSHRTFPSTVYRPPSFVFPVFEKVDWEYLISSGSRRVPPPAALPPPSPDGCAKYTDDRGPGVSPAITVTPGLTNAAPAVKTMTTTDDRKYLRYDHRELKNSFETRTLIIYYSTTCRYVKLTY